MLAYIKVNNLTVSLPINAEEKEDKIFLSFQFNKDLINTVKSEFESARWEKPYWVIPKTKRNLNVLSLLTRSSDPLANLYKPIKDQRTNLRFTPLAPLWEHQWEIVNTELTKERCIIAGEMRIGKTLPTLSVLNYLNQTEPDFEAWWVAPKSAINGLKLELRKWGISQYRKGEKWLKLMTYDFFRKLSSVNNFSADCIVFDEAHKLKNPKAQVTQAALATECRYLFLLSGTPSPKDPTDWWSLTEITYPGFLRESTKAKLANVLGKFEERQGQVGQMYYHLIEWKIDQVERLHRRLKPLILVLLKKNCLSLPPKLYTEVNLPISDDYIKAIAFVDLKMGKGTEALNRLRQLSDGFMYQTNPLPDGTSERKTVYLPSCPKDEQLLSDLEELSDKLEQPRVVIYCGFQGTIDKLVKIIPSDWAILKIDGRSWEALNTTHSTQSLLSEMDASSSKVIDKLLVLAQADAASTGLELSAAEKVIYYSNSFSGAARLQSEDRAYSFNNSNLEIVDYIHLPTDKLVKDNLLLKKDFLAITLGEIVESLKSLKGEEYVR
jgi:SNF2 family DNA or RNA helicase